MDPQLKQEWLAALRSGNYTQGTGYLRLGAIWRKDRKVAHCCLGVLCELAAKHGLGKWGTEADPDGEGLENDFYFLSHSDTMPPDSLLQRIGLHEDHANALAKMNDEGQTFTKIANYIEEHV